MFSIVRVQGGYKNQADDDEDSEESNDSYFLDVKEQPLSEPEDNETFGNESFSEKQLEDSHSLDLTGGDCYVCGLCKSKFNEIDEFANHFSEFHGKPNTCKTCYKTFDDEYVLNNHLHLSDPKVSNLKVTKRDIFGESKENGKVPYKCSECDKTFMSYINFSAHVKVMHSINLGGKLDVNGTRHNCNECSLSFKYKPNLVCHRKLHSPSVETEQETEQLLEFPSCSKNGRKTHTCKVCSATFKYNRNFLCHMKSHTTENVTSPKRIRSNKTATDATQKRHTYSEIIQRLKFGKGIKEATCNICSATFYNDVELSMHSYSHYYPKCILPVKTKRTESSDESKKDNESVGHKFQCETCGAHFRHKCNRDFHRELRICHKQKPERKKATMPTKVVHKPRKQNTESEKYLEKILENLKSLSLKLERSSPDEMVLRSSITTSEQVEDLVVKIAQVTNSNFIVYWMMKNVQKILFHKKWICRYSHRHNPKKNTNCNASVDVLIKKVNRFTQRNDCLLKLTPPLCCVIKLKPIHNHPTSSTDSRRMRWASN